MWVQLGEGHCLLWRAHRSSHDNSKAWPAWAAQVLLVSEWGGILRSNSALSALPIWALSDLLGLLGPSVDLCRDLCLYLVQRGREPKVEIKSGEVHSLGAGLGWLGLCPGTLGLSPEKLDLLRPGGRGSTPSMLMLAHLAHAGH